MTKELNIVQPKLYSEAEYWAANPIDAVEFYQRRREYIEEYAFAIPTVEAVTKIASFGKIVEVGAGTGYWAKLIAEAGADIVAYDTFESHCKYHGKYFDIQRGGPLSLLKHSDRALFLCWPPMTDMAEQCLQFWKGNDLIVIGEENGCTGTREFEELLTDEFQEPDYIYLPQWYGIHDTLRVFHRKGILKSWNEMVSK